MSADAIEIIRHDFPMLYETNRGKPLIYLDSAASMQKPLVVIEAMKQFYMHDYANIHRGVYEISERATAQFEDTREVVRSFINAKSIREIIFVRGTTEAINLVAQSLGREQWQAGDEVILSVMEHHSNIVPWYLLSQQIGIVLKVIPITDSGELDLAAYQQLFSSRTKLVALSHASNAVGTINPVKQCVAWAHEKNVPVLLDGAQAVAHMPVDVQEIDCDFYAFSAHKMYGPTGAGILYGKETLLEGMSPYQGGGDMIESVTFDKITFAKLPYCFEAGTPDIAAVIGLKTAIHYLQAIGWENIQQHERDITRYTYDALTSVSDIRLIGTAKERLSVFSFVMAGIHPHDVGTILDAEGIAIRAGHHCAMPLMHRFGVPATVRASMAIYSDESDIDALIEGLHSAKRLFN